MRLYKSTKRLIMELYPTRQSSIVTALAPQLCSSLSKDLNRHTLLKPFRILPRDTSLSYYTAWWTRTVLKESSSRIRITNTLIHCQAQQLIKSLLRNKATPSLTSTSFLIMQQWQQLVLFSSVYATIQAHFPNCKSKRLHITCALTISTSLVR